MIPREIRRERSRNIIFGIRKNFASTPKPLDFVGEMPLGAGPWSYHLTITDYTCRGVTVMARPD